MLQTGRRYGGPLDVRLLKARFDPDQFSYFGSPPPSWPLLLSNRPCQVGMKGALMFLGGEGGVGGKGGGGGGWFPGRRRRAIWGSWGGSLCWCCGWQLQFHSPLFPTGQPPSPRNGNQAEGRWSGDPGREGALEGCRWGEIQSGFLVLKTTSEPYAIPPTPPPAPNYSIPSGLPLGPQGGCIYCWGRTG